MTKSDLAGLQAEISTLQPVRVVGRVRAVQGNTLHIGGLTGQAKLGDRIRVYRRDGGHLSGEVLQMDEEAVVMLPDETPIGVSLGDRASLFEASSIAPANNWVGRIIDPFWYTS